MIPFSPPFFPGLHPATLAICSGYSLVWLTRWGHVALSPYEHSNLTCSFGLTFFSKATTYAFAYLHITTLQLNSNEIQYHSLGDMVHDLFPIKGVINNKNILLSVKFSGQENFWGVFLRLSILLISTLRSLWWTMAVCMSVCVCKCDGKMHCQTKISDSQGEITLMLCEPMRGVWKGAPPRYLALCWTIYLHADFRWLNPDSCGSYYWALIVLRRSLVW